jgi:hypothetical protein
MIKFDIKWHENIERMESRMIHGPDGPETDVNGPSVGPETDPKRTFDLRKLFYYLYSQSLFSESFSLISDKIGTYVEQNLPGFFSYRKWVDSWSERTLKGP